MSRSIKRPAEPVVDSALDLTTLLSRVDVLRRTATRAITSARRAELGQFLTPAPLARMVAEMLDPSSSCITILDAGAGVGSLAAAAIEHLGLHAQPPQTIHVVAYEVEEAFLPNLHTILHWCQVACAQRGIMFTSEVRSTDFIADAVEQLTHPLFAAQRSHYTCAILNPPYRKIQTTSRERLLLRRVGVEASNLYTGFLALALHLLAPDGQLAAITPRSFCNGPYFRPFRALLLDTMALRRVHVFDSRQHAFRDDAVLQEHIVWHAVKSRPPPSTVTLTASAMVEDEAMSVRDVPYAEVVHPNDPQQFLHLVPDLAAQRVATHMAALPSTLADLNIMVSTGRVVEFRAADFVHAAPGVNTAPLIYPAHLRDGYVVWPRLDQKKANALVVAPATRELFIPNATYVLVKRFSAKEERRRVVAAVSDPTTVPGDLIGFENHLNYFHQNGHGLDPLFARGLAVFLNSTLVDAYFRQFNGHTQVNATDLRTLRYPSHAQIYALGTPGGDAPSRAGGH